MAVIVCKQLDSGLRRNDGAQFAEEIGDSIESYPGDFGGVQTGRSRFTDRRMEQVRHDGGWRSRTRSE